MPGGRTFQPREPAPCRRSEAASATANRVLAESSRRSNCQRIGNAAGTIETMPHVHSCGNCELAEHAKLVQHRGVFGRSPSPGVSRHGRIRFELLAIAFVAGLIATAIFFTLNLK